MHCKREFRNKRQANVEGCALQLHPEGCALQKGVQEQTSGKRSNVKTTIPFIPFLLIIYENVLECAIKKKGGPPFTYSCCEIWRNGQSLFNTQRGDCGSRWGAYVRQVTEL